MTKVLVTGGLGFIGSHIVDLLIEKDYEVVIVDDISTGSKENLNKDAKFYKTDICDPDLKADPRFDAEVNILGSINLLECCREFDVKKIVYASSGGAVYGEPQYLPVDEEHPIRPLWVMVTRLGILFMSRMW